MKTIPRIFLSLVFCCCASLAMASNEITPPDNDGYAVVVSKQTYADPQWKAVVEALVKKHDAVVIEYEKNLDEAIEPLRMIFPRYACFVAQPDEAGRDFVMSVHRMTRCLDADPYTDVMWGIVTGYSAEDALRIAQRNEPLIVRKGAGGTGINLDLFDEGIYYDEGSKASYVEKNAGGPIKKKTGTGDDAQPIAEMLSNLKPDLFVTSGHATEHDWQIGYPTGNDKGMFISKAGKMIAVSRNRKTTTPVESPNPKIYLPWGNCLMGHIIDKDSMALAWMRSAGVHQMYGYIVPTWYGRGGPGTNKYFFSEPGRYTLSESFFFNNQTIVDELETRFPKTARLAFNRLDTENDQSLLNKIAMVLVKEDDDLRKKVEAASRERKQSSELKDNLGLLYDRDVLAFYGDPAWEARMAPRELPFTQTLSEKNGKYMFRIVASADCEPECPPAMLLPHRLENVEVLKGQELSPLIADNFIMLMKSGKFKAGETYEVVFKAKKIEPSAAVSDGKSALKYQVVKLPPVQARQGNAGLDLNKLKRFKQLLDERLKKRDPEALGLFKNGQLELTPEIIMKLLGKWEEEEKEKKPLPSDAGTGNGPVKNP